ncbi:MAG: cold shock domain-containing protein [Phycisphaerales bacterium JB043]
MSDQVETAGNSLENIEGNVKWFDPRKGFGFIVGPDGQDIFVHYTSIQGEGFRVLKDGAPVRYSAELTPKGWHATSVTRTDDAEIHVRPQQAARSPRR